MNYSKFSGQFVCKMAMLLAFMFAACSETDSGNNVAGGTVEETGVYALVGQMGDIYPRLLQMGDSEGAYDGSVFAEKGMIVIVHELDSLTFDTTGRSFADTVDNDEGRFAFESLTLNSPYVLIEKREPYHSFDVHVVLGETKLDTTVKYRAFKSIVDLRKTQSVSVNSLTSAKVPLLREFIADGKTFEEANRMAEREVLEGLGVYKDLGAFETLNAENSELSYVNALMQYDDHNLRRYFEMMSRFVFYASPQKYVGKGKIIEQPYLNFLKMIDYEVGYLAKLEGLERCTESRENDVGKVKGLKDGYFINVVCRSGKWTMGFKPIEHVNGTMVDNRDGKEYKTVTYNWVDGPQTWMAENLDFADVDGASCTKRSYGEPDCESDGHEYPWIAAMKIDYDDLKVYSIGSKGDTAFITKECIDFMQYEGEWYGDWEPWEAVRDRCDVLSFDMDTTTFEMNPRIWYSNYSDLVKKSDVNSYQGICPDGWRIPTSKDWASLLYHLGNQYGVDYSHVVPVLYDQVATGFGLYSSVGLFYSDGHEGKMSYHGGSFRNDFLVADAPWFFVGLFTGSYKVDFYGFGFEMPSDVHYFMRYIEMFSLDRDYMNGYDPYDSAPIRCIKN